MIKETNAIVRKYNGVFDSMGRERKIMWELNDEFNNKYLILNANEYKNIISPKLNLINKFLYGKWCVKKNHLDSLGVSDKICFKYMTIKDINYVVKIISFEFK